MLKKKMLMFFFRNKKTQKWRYNPSGYISASSHTMFKTANWDVFDKKKVLNMNVNGLRNAEI